MKIFPRTLISFAAVIGIQAVLTGGLISRSVERYHEDDARRELRAAAVEAFDGFNSWKSRLWRAVAGLSALGEPEDADLYGLIRRSAEEAGADYVVISAAGAGGAGEPVRMDVGRAGSGGPDGRLLRNRKTHPHIQTVLLPDAPYLVGALRIAGHDAFILKRIDNHLADQIGSRPRTVSLILVGSRFSAGRDPGAVARRVFDHPPATIYTVLPDLEVGKTHWAAVIQSAGEVEDGRPSSAQDGAETLPLRVVTLLSKADFQRRLNELRYAVVTATSLCAVLTILIGLGFSGNMAYPIRRLVEAMRRLRDGDFAVAVGSAAYAPGGEIGELVAGFDEMARTLETDRIERERYIEEIEGMTIFNRELLDSLEEGVAVLTERPSETGGSYRIEQANRAFGKLFPTLADGTADRPLEDLADKLADTELASLVHRTDGAGPTLSRLRRTEDRRTLELKIYPLAAGPIGTDGLRRRVLIIEDVTQRIAYEEKIFQAEKLASVSMLSAGVAHEINNPLTSILSNAQNLIEEERDGDKAEALRLIEQETRRIARIVRELLDFSAPRGSDNEGTEAAATILGIQRLLGYSVSGKGQVKIETDLEEGLPPVALGRDAFKQVMINLLKNSLHAVGEGGTIRVGLRRNGAKGAAIEVADTGSGIERDALSRIFDPFYTTKPDGTGMGLSVVYGIVRRAGGSISAESEPGKGTTMRLELPFLREAE